ncbi:XAP5, circadian clock regulator-domain-containing protein [Massariosphaeria phaeospora]|uniref:XAP5, circadian clock regulator-domain-containing protein n=1 Tax=Massariosphaeria phaeospora TaxID=100035 RepID=A0A7C8I001_9PLEO|nr:XAP5, circadian clock regulator-domain-containing protein [Massariosphaeria phaeospora]
MDKFAPSESSRTGVPADSNSRFTSQSSTTEDLLKQQTVGLVALDDFRKRRAEALERKERAASRGGSGASTPQDGGSTPRPFKKKRLMTAKGKLSFADDDEHDDASNDFPSGTRPRGSTPADSAGTFEPEGRAVKKKLAANTGIGLKPRVMTKSALQREAQQAEIARQDFVGMRDAVKATEVVVPFVFYDGTNTPGGRCRVKKGDHIWLVLDKARKVGAELGVGGDKGRRDWARVSVDDLMLVRDEVIVPHHYELYHFLFNKVVAFNGPLFDYSAQTTKATPIATDAASADVTNHNPLDRPDKNRDRSSAAPDAELEGFGDDASITKVVDRRWYERNKHIFPASVWVEYSPGKEISKMQRKDTEGNSFFFS